MKKGILLTILLLLLAFNAVIFASAAQNQPLYGKEPFHAERIKALQEEKEQFQRDSALNSRNMKAMTAK